MVNGRPRMTQEELDQDMDNYWGGASGGAPAGGDVGPGSASASGVGPVDESAPASTTAATVGDDDVDMIE